MKQNIDVFEYFNTILNSVKTGVLVTTKVGNKINCMTISWGQIGIEWNKLIFTIFIRKGRFTHDLLEKSGEFTINIPFDNEANEILKFCGTKSGKDIDKINELKLNIVEGDKIETPGIKELPLTLECKIIYKQIQDENMIMPEIKKRFYPNNVSSSYAGSNQDLHTMFYGEIIGAYIAK